MHMKFEVDIGKNGFAELVRGTIKYWVGEGLPSFEGSLDGFAEAYPEAMQELLDRKIINKTE